MFVHIIVINTLQVKLKVNSEGLKGIQNEKEPPQSKQTSMMVQGKAEKRDPKATILLCSPYRNRKVDAKAIVSKEELSVANWIFSDHRNKM